jgi:hypothetical protein
VLFKRYCELYPYADDPTYLRQVVQQGLVLGVEAIEGTDALILRAGALKREPLAPRSAVHI